MPLESIKALGAGLAKELFDQVHDSVIALDLDGIVRACNRGAERLHGYRAAELIGQHVCELCAEQAACAATLGHLARTRAQGFDEYECWMVRQGATPRRAHVRLSLMSNPRGEAVGYLGIAMDITDLFAARAALEQRDRQIHALLEAADVALAYVGKAGAIEYASPTFVSLVGEATPAHRAPRDDASNGGRLARDFPTHYSRIASAVERALAGSRISKEIEQLTPAGECRTLLAQLTPDVDASGVVQGYVELLTDITDSKRVAVAALESERRLRDAVVSEAHHRLKNTLQGVVGLLRVRAAEGPEGLATIESAVGQLTAVAMVFDMMSAMGTKGVTPKELAFALARQNAASSATSIETSCVAAAAGARREVLGSFVINMALVINELIFNAIKHGGTVPGMRPISLAVREEPERVRIRIFNDRVQLPRGVDFVKGLGLGTGLMLMKQLLPPELFTMRLENEAGGVLAELCVEEGALESP